MLLANTDPLLPEHFSLPSSAEKHVGDDVENLNMEENERMLIINALVQCDSNSTRAAKLLGISRDTLIRKKKKYGINHTIHLPNNFNNNFNHI